MKECKWLLTLFFCLTTTLYAAGWTGSTSEPGSSREIDGKSFYVITNAEELAWFAAQVNGGTTSINAILDNDIVFGTDENTTCATAWTPIGKDSTHIFVGVLDGAEHTIFGLYVNNQKFAGLVGIVGKSGIVKNMTLTKGKINGTVYAGGITALNHGTIKNVDSRNEIKVVAKIAYSGGITGYNTSSISDSKNSGSVSASFEANNSKIKAFSYSGGIAGYNTATISNCKNTGTVSTSNTSSNSYDANSRSYSGGITGYNTGSVSKCVNSGTCSSSAKANYADSPDTHAGGIVGYNTGSVFQCSNSGNVSSSNNTYSTTNYNHTYAGGIVGLTTKTISDCFNSGITSASGYYDYSNGLVASGNAKKSFDIVSFKYWLNSVETQGTEDFLKQVEFAWILNTANGTEANSGIWSWNNGFPFFADEGNKPTYRVTFNDGIVDSYSYTSYMGKTPKPADPEPDLGHRFVAWIDDDGHVFQPRETVSKDKTFYAEFTLESGAKYIITIIDGTSTYGIVTNENGKLTSLPPHASAPENYEFSGWFTPQNEKVDENTVFTAATTITAKYSAIKYQITFLDYDDKLIDELQFEYGTLPQIKNPTRPRSENYSYSFKEWSPSISIVEGAATYKAVYDSTKLTKVSVTINNKDTTIVVGDEYILPSAPDSVGYSFIGWYDSDKKYLGKASDKITITKNIVIAAQYKANTVPQSSSSTQSSNSANSSNSAKPSSSATPKSSGSSGNTDAIPGQHPTRSWTISSSNRAIQIHGVLVGRDYAILDMQGRVLSKGQARNSDISYLAPYAGHFIVRIDNRTQLVNVK